MINILTFSGSAKHGKDANAIAIKRELENAGEKVLLIHLADYLKFLAKALYGWNGKKDEKGRSLLQRIGRELREFSESILVDELIKIIDLSGSMFDYILIPDARFPNELEIFKRNPNYKVTSFHISRLWLPKEEELTEEQKNDVTETSMKGIKYDYNFVYEGIDIEDVEKNIKNFFTEWKKDE